MDLSMSEAQREFLDEMSLSNILRGLMLLVKGNPNFRIEDLRDGLERARTLYPRLTERDTDNVLDNLLFLDAPFINGELNLPHYRLSREGRNLYARILDREYGAEALEQLKPLAEEVWKVRRPF